MLIELLVSSVTAFTFGLSVLLGRVPGIGDGFASANTLLEGVYSEYFPKVKGFIEVFIDSGDLAIMLSLTLFLITLMFVTYIIGWVGKMWDLWGV